MKVAQFEHDGNPLIGIRSAASWINYTKAAAVFYLQVHNIHTDPAWTITDLLEHEEFDLEELAAVDRFVRGNRLEKLFRVPKEARMKAPLARPRRDRGPRTELRPSCEGGERTGAPTSRSSLRRRDRRSSGPTSRSVFRRTSGGWTMKWNGARHQKDGERDPAGRGAVVRCGIYRTERRDREGDAGCGSREARALVPLEEFRHVRADGTVDGDRRRDQGSGTPADRMSRQREAPAALQHETPGLPGSPGAGVHLAEDHPRAGGCGFHRDP